jgi:hypothetical protein
MTAHDERGGKVTFGELYRRRRLRKSVFSGVDGFDAGDAILAAQYDGLDQ